MSTAIHLATLPIGSTLPERRWTVTVEQIREYAKASGDRNPIHLDEAFARSVGLPGVIAHGMLTMAVVGQLVTGWLGDPSRLKAFRGRFAGMVLPGEELRCSGVLTRKDEDRRRLTIELTAVNQRGEQVFTKGIAEVEF